MQPERLKYLFTRYQEQQLSQEEEAEWLALLTDAKQEQLVHDLADTVFEQDDLLKYQMPTAKAEEILQTILMQPQQRAPKKIYLWRRMAIAASLLLVTSIGVLIYNNRNQEPQTAAIEYANDVLPGKKGAILTLADGKNIALSEAKNGLIAEEAGLSVTQNNDGQLLYEIKSSGASHNPNSSSKNTLTTSNGQTYQVRLPDGSLAFLNAASSLTYSTTMDEQGKRKVYLTGEGYFEVAKDPKHPFIVKTKNQEIEVLGTHFNVNSYGDEGFEKTTLLEGSVKVSVAGNTRFLKPNEQAKVADQMVKVAQADADLAVAWKNNEFAFESENIENVMKMVERWYNVKVVYTGPKTTEKFTGRVSRFDKVSKVLKVVESTGAVQFKVQGNIIYVM